MLLQSSDQGRGLVRTFKWLIIGAAASIATVFGTFSLAPATAQDVPPPGNDVSSGDPVIVDHDGDDEGENYSNAVIACFAEGTSDEYVAQIEAQVHAINEAILGPRYQLTNRWTGTQGNPVTLTWSFAPDGLSIPSGIGEGTGPNTLFATLDADFAAQGGRAAWINRFQQVFDRFQAISGITYQRITVGGNDWDDGASWGSSGAAGLRGDIRICAKAMDGTNNVLAYNNFPGTGTGGNMHLDSAENWGSTSSSNRFLRNTIAHEHGHGIGLLHVCPVEQTKLMEPFLSTAFDGPRHDDFRGSQRHYGDPYESDNTTATANPLGTLTFGSTVTPCTIPSQAPFTNPASTSICTIDADAEQDYFSFAVTGTATCNITVTPLGLTYEDCGQDSQCTTASCSTSTNSLTLGNLAVQLIATNGTTVLAEASAAAAGTAETITGASLGAAGTYFVRVYETATLSQAQMYSLTIVANSAGCTAPSITGQPGNQTVCSGGSATFTVTATGTSPTYQWRRGTTNLVNGGAISGATSPTLTINPVAAGDAGTNYNCVVTNGCGSATSNNATLTVNAAAAITGQPTNQTACSGSSASFSVTASGTPAPTFQWRRGTTNLTNGGNISGATSATLTINPVGAGDAGTNYNCVVTNSCGSATSNNATLTVNVAPSITGQPANQTGCSGSSASFSVTAAGTPAPTFQWRRGTTNLTNGGNISGATSATLTINPLAPGDAATNYNCVVTNSCGSATSNNASLTVNVAAAITGQPSNQTVNSGGSASFSVTATGTPAPTFQWRRGTTNLVNGGNISGATTATLTINPATATDEATDYNCVVTNVCGSATSNNASLDVTEIACPGDLNNDGVVDIGDLAIILANFGVPSGATPEQGDLDGDGDVEIDDLATFLALFGTTCP